jgi:purine nucleosidase
LDVVIDTDPGIDDALALMLALRSPEVDVRGITVVHGNVPVDKGIRNAFRILDLLGRRDVPVAAGAAVPLLREPTDWPTWSPRRSMSLRRPWPARRSSFGPSRRRRSR